jgi:hypothetical protein
MCYCHPSLRPKAKEEVDDFQEAEDSEWPEPSHPVPGTVVPFTNTTPFSLDARSMSDGQFIATRTIEPTATEKRLSTGQVEFVHDLYRMNIPAPAIADVMDRMLREGKDLRLAVSQEWVPSVL